MGVGRLLDMDRTFHWRRVQIPFLRSLSQSFGGPKVLRFGTNHFAFVVL